MMNWLLSIFSPAAAEHARMISERERLARRLASAKPRSHAAAALERDLQRVTHDMLRAEARVARWMGVRG